MRELPQVEREIGAVRFQLTTLPYEPSKAALLILSRRVFPSLKEALRGVDLTAAGGDRGKMMATLLPRALEAIADVLGALTDAELTQLENLFGEFSAYHNGTDASGLDRWAPMTKANRADLFGGGNMMLYLRWLAACVEVTFGDFFAAFRGGLAPS